MNVLLNSQGGGFPVLRSVRPLPPENMSGAAVFNDQGKEFTGVRAGTRRLASIYLLKVTHSQMFATVPPLRAQRPSLRLTTWHSVAYRLQSEHK